nr:nonstructural polyprotein [Hepelivirales sp.]
MSLIVKPFPHGNEHDFHSINQEYDRLAIRSAKNINSNPIVVPFRMTIDEHALFAELIAPQIFVYGEELKEHPHPIPALLHKIAYEQFEKTAFQMKKKYNTNSIDIGGNFERKKDTHVCAKITSNRELSRYLQAALRSSDECLVGFYNSKNQNDFKMGLVCNKGAEKCNFHAPYAYSVNANYDITFEQIAQMFQMHKIITYDVAMFLPSQLLDRRFNINSGFYNVMSDPNGFKSNKLVFSLNDYSFAYSHDYDNWRRYLTTTYIKCKNFSITIEITKSYKDFCFLRFTRVKNFMLSNEEKLIRVIPTKKLYGDYYIIPNIRKYFTNFFKIGDLYRDIQLIQKEFVDGVMKWANGATDDQFKYNSFSTWCRSQSQMIQFDPTGLNLAVIKGLKTDIENYEQIVCNLFVLSAIKRWHRTKFISKAFNNIKSISKSKVIRLCTQVLKRTIGTLMDVFRDLPIQYAIEHHNDPSALMPKVYNLINCELIPLQELVYAKTVKFGDIELIDDENDLHIATIKNEDLNIKTQEIYQASVYTEGQCGVQAFDEFYKHKLDKSLVLIEYDDNMIDEFKKNKYLVCTKEGKTEMSFTENELQRIEKKRLNRESTWLETSEMLFIAFINKLNIRIITNENSIVMVVNKDVTEFNTIIIDFKNNHWSYARNRGGYKVIANISEPHTIKKIEETSYYQLLNTTINTKERMKLKMEEIYRYILNNCPNSPIVDMTAAPGTFYDIAKKNNRQISAYSIDEGNTHKGEKEIKYYKKYAEIEFVKNAIYFFDFPLSEKTADLITYFKLNKAYNLLAKFDAFNEDSIKQHNIMIKNFESCSYFYAENSKNTAGEIYVLYTTGIIAPSVNSTVVNKMIKESINDKDEQNYVKLKKYHNHKVLDTERFKDHAIITVDVTSVKEFINKNSQFIPKTDVKYNEIKYKIPIINGAAGSRKTQGVLHTKCTCDYIVSPIRNNSHENSTYITFIANLLNDKLPQKPNSVIIDEFNAMHPSAIAYYIYLKEAGFIKNIYLMGDSYQIKYYNYFADTTEIVVTDDHYLSVTYRSPQDAANYASNLIKKKITSSSKIVKSFEFVEYTALEKINVNKMYDGICFTQSMKEILARMNIKCITAHESESMTLRNVNLFVQDLQRITCNERFRYAYVAITRHTDRIVVYGQSNELHVFMNLLGHNVENQLMITNVPLVNDTHILSEPSVDIMKERIETDKTSIPVALVEQILSNAVLQTNNRDPEIEVKPLVLPSVNVGNIKINEAHLMKQTIETVGNKLALGTYVNKYYSKDSIDTVSTMLKRYANRKVMAEQQKTLLNGLYKFVDQHKLLKPNSNSEIWKHFTDYLIELQKKLQSKSKECEDINMLLKETSDEEIKQIANELKSIMNSTITVINMPDDINNTEKKIKSLNELEAQWDNKYTMYVNFIMKKQDKHLSNHGKDFCLKAGQGVSSWSKILNIIFCAYSRVLTEKLFHAAKDNVLIAYNKSDAELSNFFSKFKEYYGKSQYVNLDNDFSEMDTSHGRSAIENEMLLFASTGMPYHLQQYYWSMRHKWVMSYQNSDGNSKIFGEFMQHSGQPLTITGNTILNIAAVGATIDIKHMLYAAFKGDDSTIRAINIKVKKTEKDYLYTELGYKFKIVQPRVSEFIANIITPDGFFPDVIRRTQKVVSKIYEDEQSWEISRINIKESVDTVLTNEQFIIGSQVAHIHYRDNNINISPENIRILYTYLKQLSTSNYEKLDFTKTKKFITQYVTINQ